MKFSYVVLLESGLRAPVLNRDEQDSLISISETRDPDYVFVSFEYVNKMLYPVKRSSLSNKLKLNAQITTFSSFVLMCSMQVYYFVRKEFVFFHLACKIALKAPFDVEFGTLNGQG